jgi:hypothetical protein
MGNTWHCSFPPISILYSTAVSSNISAIDETPPAISPTKEEVKAEQDMLHSIATDFECKLE